MSATLKRLGLVTQQVMQLRDHKADPAAAPGLDALFDELALMTPSRPPHEIEDEIWALWTGHTDPAAAARLDSIIPEIAQRRFDVAEPALDLLVADQPKWAEAWNKRATVYFLMNRDYDALGDIRMVLSLEPRHFGALNGLAQIALRRNDPAAALAAMEAVLHLNPHAGAVKLRASQLRTELHRTAH